MDTRKIEDRLDFRRIYLPKRAGRILVIKPPSKGFAAEIVVDPRLRVELPCGSDIDIRVKRVTHIPSTAEWTVAVISSEPLNDHPHLFVRCRRGDFWIEVGQVSYCPTKNKHYKWLCFMEGWEHPIATQIEFECPAGVADHPSATETPAE